MNWIRKRVREETRRLGNRGVEVLEMALIMPILLGLIMGMIEFGWFFYLQHNLQAAAREGARTGSTLNATDADAVNKANAFLAAANLNAGSFNVTSTTANGTVTVTVQATWGQVG